MSHHHANAYPPGQMPSAPPYPTQNAYPPQVPGGFAPPPGPYGFGPPPPGQSGFGPYPPGQPGFQPPHPGQPGFVQPPPTQPGFGPPPPGQFGFGPPQPGYSASGYGAVPPYGVPPPTYTSGNQSDDSQPGDEGWTPSAGSRTVKCTFVNHAGIKVILGKINEKGRVRKFAKLKEGRQAVFSATEGDLFVARGRRRRTRNRLLINNNSVYTVMLKHDGDNSVTADIRCGPESFGNLSSMMKSNVEVRVKFVNRSKKAVQLAWMNHGKKEKAMVVASGKCLTTTLYEGGSWVAYDVKRESDTLFLNYAPFYSPWKTRRRKERVLITQHRPWRFSSGSSSSSSSSSSRSSSSSSD